MTKSRYLQELTVITLAKRWDIGRMPRFTEKPSRMANPSYPLEPTHHCSFPFRKQISPFQERFRQRHLNKEEKTKKRNKLVDELII